MVLSDPDHPSGSMEARAFPPEPAPGPAPGASDRALIAAGFRAVYDQHFRFVWRVLARLGVPDESLDDAVQDAFIVVHRRLPEFEGRSKLSTWLYAIAFRVATDHLRRARRRGRLVQLDPEAHESGRPDPLELAAQSRDSRVLRELLDTLDHDQRTVFVLAELEGCTAAEISEILGIGVNTVYSRLSRGRGAFEKAVGRYQARQARSQR